jgi:hypothetical protein
VNVHIAPLPAQLWRLLLKQWHCDIVAAHSLQRTLVIQLATILNALVRMASDHILYPRMWHTVNAADMGNVKYLIAHIPIARL